MSLSPFILPFVTFFSFSVFGVCITFGCFKEVSRMFKKSFKGVSRKFQGGFKKVIRVFQESFKEISRKFRGRF